MRPGPRRSHRRSSSHALPGGYSHCRKCAMREDESRPAGARQGAARRRLRGDRARHMPGVTRAVHRGAPRTSGRAGDFRRRCNAFWPNNVVVELCSLVVLSCPFSAFPAHSIGERRGGGLERPCRCRRPVHGNLRPGPANHLLRELCHACAFAIPTLSRPWRSFAEDRMSDNPAAGARQIWGGA